MLGVVVYPLPDDIISIAVTTPLETVVTASALIPQSVVGAAMIRVGAEV